MMASSRKPDFDGPVGKTGSSPQRFPASGKCWLDRLHQAEKLFACSKAIHDWRGWHTYADIGGRSNQLGHFLQKRGIRPNAGDVVGIIADRTADTVVAMLAVLKAGAAILMLDPTYPERRLTALIELTRPRILIETSTTTVLVGPGMPSRVRICDSSLDEFATSKLETQVNADGLAYLASTSGSTGHPRIVCASHRPWNHFFSWYIKRFKFGPNDSFSMLSGLSHDPLFRDVFTPLLVGAKLHIPSLRHGLASARLGEWMAQAGVTVTHLTPSLGRVIASSDTPLPKLRMVMFGGEPLYSRFLHDFEAIATKATVVNLYGATETPQVVSFHVVPRGGGSDVTNVSIGQGAPGTELLILDEEGRPLASQATIGQLAVRSPQLALRYLHDENETARKFIKDPARVRSRLYLTGDLARSLPCGNIELCGRNDHQVSVNGLRIEPAEIVQALLEHPRVMDAVVMPDLVGAASPVLVAHLVGDEKPEANNSRLREYLRCRLPAPMVPSRFVWHECFPTTPNGKIDLEAIKIADETPKLRTKDPTPSTSTESTLADIWKEVCPTIETPDDSFFEAGGDSLAWAMIGSRVEELWGVAILPGDMYRFPTIRSLAAEIDSETQETERMLDDLLSTDE